MDGDRPWQRNAKVQTAPAALRTDAGIQADFGTLPRLEEENKLARQLPERNLRPGWCMDAPASFERLVLGCINTDF